MYNGVIRNKVGVDVGSGKPPVLVLLFADTCLPLIRGYKRHSNAFSENMLLESACLLVSRGCFYVFLGYLACHPFVVPSVR